MPFELSRLARGVYAAEMASASFADSRTRACTGTHRNLPVMSDGRSAPHSRPVSSTISQSMDKTAGSDNPADRSSRLASATTSSSWRRGVCARPRKALARARPRRPFVLTVRCGNGLRF